MEGLLNNYCEN